MRENPNFEPNFGLNGPYFLPELTSLFFIQCEFFLHELIIRLMRIIFTFFVTQDARLMNFLATNSAISLVD